MNEFIYNCNRTWIYLTSTYWTFSELRDNVLTNHRQLKLNKSSTDPIDKQVVAKFQKCRLRCYQQYIALKISVGLERDIDYIIESMIIIIGFSKSPPQSPLRPQFCHLPLRQHLEFSRQSQVHHVPQFSANHICDHNRIFTQTNGSNPICNLQLYNCTALSIFGFPLSNESLPYQRAVRALTIIPATLFYTRVVLRHGQVAFGITYHF